MSSLRSVALQGQALAKLSSPLKKKKITVKQKPRSIFRKFLDACAMGNLELIRSCNEAVNLCDGTYHAQRVCVLAFVMHTTVVRALDHVQPMATRVCIMRHCRHGWTQCNSSSS